MERRAVALAFEPAANLQTPSGAGRAIMPANDLDHLLERMERISKAVNSFASESVQQLAFEALMATFQGRSLPGRSKPSPPTPDEPRVQDPGHPTLQKAAGRKARKAKA